MTETPFKEAVTVAVCAEGIVPAVTVKVPVVAPAATVAEAGVVSRALLSDTVTTVPPAGAAFDNVTVQVAVEAEFKLVGLQTSEVSLSDATRLIEEVRETPLREADRVAV
jgi:hypothetical protein